MSDEQNKKNDFSHSQIMKLSIEMRNPATTKLSTLLLALAR